MYGDNHMYSAPCVPIILPWEREGCSDDFRYKIFLDLAQYTSYQCIIYSSWIIEYIHDADWTHEKHISAEMYRDGDQQSRNINTPARPAIK